MIPTIAPACIPWRCAGVADLQPGDRVAYPLHPGSYSEAKLIPADLLVPVPDGVTDEQAAAILLKGLTAHYLLRRIYPVGPEDTILIHAAAGGVGLIACQWASHLGAAVIGTVGSDDKADLARANGCRYPVVYSRESFVDKVRELTGGAGLPVVYDSVGKDTFHDSLDCLAPMGIMVSFGQSSGPVPPFDPGILARKGSLFLTRPTLAHYIARRGDLLSASTELFDLVRSGAIRTHIGQTYDLKNAAQAHRDLEARMTSGSTILIP